MRLNRIFTLKKLIIVLSLLLTNQLNSAAFYFGEDTEVEESVSPFILSPEDTTRLIDDAKKPSPNALIKGKIFSRYEAILKSLKHPFQEGLGVSVTGMYTGLGQIATEGHPHHSTAGAAVSLYASKNLFRDIQSPSNLTTLAIHCEERHKYTTIPPQELGAMFHSLLPTTTDFETNPFEVKDLWLQERLLNDKAIIRAGKFSFKSISNDYSFDSSKMTFIGEPFTGNPGLYFPNNPLGVQSALEFYHGLFGGLAIMDASTLRVKKPIDLPAFESLKTATDHHRKPLFESFQFGYRTLFYHAYNTLYRVLFWNVEPSAKNNRFFNTKGLSVLLQQDMPNNIIPFFRYEINNGRYIDFKQAMIVGAGLPHPFHQEFSLIGMGFSFQTPSDKAIKPEYTFEGFYRLQLTSVIEITPDIQLISKRGLYRQHDDKTQIIEFAGNRTIVGVFSLRLRVLE